MKATVLVPIHAINKKGIFTLFLLLLLGAHGLRAEFTRELW